MRGRPWLLGFLVALPFVPVLFGSVVSSPDIAKVYHPAAAMMAQALETGRYDRLVWNPDIAAGFPLVADGAFGVLSPLKWALVAILAPARVPSFELLIG